MTPMKLLLSLLISACLALSETAHQAARPQVPQGRVEQSDGTSIVSPSVVASSSTRRDASGALTVDLLILWRGSPGWSFRRTAAAESMANSSAARDGAVNFSVEQGGLHLTARYDPAGKTVTILGERVDLAGANVVFVDRVDSPDGPVIAGTTTVRPRNVARGLPVVPAVLRDTPELLAYLRCEAQLPEPMNQMAMNSVCTEAILRELVKADRTVTPVPAGPVTNRAAATGTPAGSRTLPEPAASSGSAVVSPVVVASWFTSRSATGGARMDLLVLWRGSLGWALREQTAGGSSGGGSGTRRGATVRYGGRSFYAAFDTGSGSRTAQIEDTTIPLGDHNVVLVDDVDSAGGPRVVKTLHVDPDLPDPRRIDAVIARSPELASYLRCDRKLDDPRQQRTMETLCARFTGR